jgi:hypothetical protein
MNAQDINTPGITFPPDFGASHKLTRGLIQSLPLKSFLVGHIAGGEGELIFADEIKTESDRDDLWDKAKASGSAGRHCSVFSSRSLAEQFIRYLKDVRRVKEETQLLRMKNYLARSRAAIDRLSRESGSAFAT